MKLTIEYVKGSGNINEERIVLKILSKLDIGLYILSDTTYRDDSTISNTLRHTFWFPDKLVNEGDFVSLFTKRGTDRQYQNKSNTITHCFYWGLETTIWNKEGDGAVVHEIGDWITKKITPKN